MEDLRNRRLGLGLSQSRLSRLAGVSRYKICLHELGDPQLKDAEAAQIESAIRKEIRRLQVILSSANDGGPRGSVTRPRSSLDPAFNRKRT